MSGSPFVNQAALDLVEGWLSKEAQIFSEFIFVEQRRQGWVTGGLELGVYKGAYLSVIAHHYLPQGVPVVGIDALLERPGKRLGLDDRRFAEQQIHDAIRNVTGQDRQVVLLGNYTREIDEDVLSAIAPRGYSFVSVDAGHDAEDLLFDTPLATRHLSDFGVIAFDDVFNAVTPGVAEGFFSWMHENRTADLACFATCGNKLFASRRATHQYWFGFSHDIAKKAANEFPALAASTAHSKWLQEINWWPTLLGDKVVPLLGRSGDAE